MNHRKAYKLSNILGISGALLMVCLYWFNNTNWAFYLTLSISVLLMISGLVISFVFYRCPHCQGRLSARLGPPTYCHHCGEKLE